MSRSTVLLIDALVSLVLGLVLVVFPKPLIEWLGIPPSETAFYPSIFGAVVIGIAIALFIEWKRMPNGLVGLGVGGAMAVDLSAALLLAGWLVVGGLNLPIRGQLVLWSVVAMLVFVSGLGLIASRNE